MPLPHVAPSSAWPTERLDALLPIPPPPPLPAPSAPPLPSASSSSFADSSPIRNVYMSSPIRPLYTHTANSDEEEFGLDDNITRLNIALATVDLEKKKIQEASNKLEVKKRKLEHQLHELKKQKLNKEQTDSEALNGRC